jgi:hypothetical protein
MRYPRIRERREHHNQQIEELPKALRDRKPTKKTRP